MIGKALQTNDINLVGLYIISLNICKLYYDICVITDVENDDILINVIYDDSDIIHNIKKDSNYKLFSTLAQCTDFINQHNPLSI